MLDALTARFGRVFLIARGAKRPGSNLRGVLVPFTPLKLTWTGRKEAKVLTCAEWFGVLPPLRGEALLSGFYVNELVLRLTEREDPHPGLFTAYVRVMEALCEDAAADRQRGLRAFEAELLRICGWPVAIDETGGEDGSGAEPAQSLRTGLADAVAREEDPCAERFWRLGELGALVPARAPADPAQARFRAWGDALVRDVLAEGLDCRWVTVGEDFRFGSGRAASVEDLTRIGAAHGIETWISPLLFHGERKVSSTRVREALAAGDFYEVSLMLGHPYTMAGRVIHGQALGRTLGYPTLNITPIPPGSRSRPALSGVFAVRVEGLLPGAALPGVASLGIRPTVSSARRWLLETHLLDWKGDAYGRAICVRFVERIREEKKFSGIEELAAAIRNDAVRARQILGLAPQG